MFSDDVSLVNITVPLLKDLEKLLLDHMSPVDKEKLPGKEVLHFIDTVVADFTRLYDDENC